MKRFLTTLLLVNVLAINASEEEIRAWAKEAQDKTKSAAQVEQFLNSSIRSVGSGQKKTYSSSIASLINALIKYAVPANTVNTPECIPESKQS
jgi:hypothetical protein